MFRLFKRSKIDIDINVFDLNPQIGMINDQLEKIMSNQEVFDSYAAQIAEQNNQIGAAVAVVISEIGKLQAASEAPLDTSKMDAAVAQLTAAVDAVEAIPSPVLEEEPAVVEPVELPLEELEEEAAEEAE